MPYPTTVPDIDSWLQRLSTTYANCFLQECNLPTHEGRKLRYLQIASGSGGRPRVLILAGIHARELAPPDAVLTFVEKLLEAYKQSQPMVYKQFDHTYIQPTGPGAVPLDARTIPLKEFIVDYPTVKRIIEHTELYVLPMANPDGRIYSRSTTARVGWRKNRTPIPGPVVIVCPPLPQPRPVPDFRSEDPTGVDLNRNFDVAWDINSYYNFAALLSGSVVVNTDPCDSQQSYGGPSAASEPETKNVQDLIVSKKINFFVDVHSAAAKFLIAWGPARNQTGDPAKTFRNHALDRSGATGGRDPAGGSPPIPSPPYAEWVPPMVEAKHRSLGDSLCAAILESTGYSKVDAASDPVAAEAHRRSAYETVQSIFLHAQQTNSPTFYAGTSRDFAFSQQIGDNAASPFKAVAKDLVYSFTLECGRDVDGGFFPDAAKEYPKVEREVGVALAKYLAFASGWSSPVPAEPPPPEPVPPSGCFSVFLAAVGLVYLVSRALAGF